MANDVASDELPSADAKVAVFLDEIVSALALLQGAARLAWYEAMITGTVEAFEKNQQADVALDRFLANSQHFAKLRAFKSNGGIRDPLLVRQVDVLYLWMLGKQVEPEALARITHLAKQAERAFNTFRGNIDGDELTQNQLGEILATSTNSEKLRTAWEARKAVGPVVAPILSELVCLRNEMARKLGFRDYFDLRITETEQNEKRLFELFDKLDELTRAPFLAAKVEVDRRLAKRLNIEPSELMPWHYQNAFFQAPPSVFDTGLDAIYARQDTVAVAKAFFAGIGFDVNAIIERSDLFEKPGKTPHCYAFSIDRASDVRIIANIVPGLYWQGSLVHELAHTVDFASVSQDLPWLLRESSHALTTEGVAMMFERLVANPLWADAMGIISSKTRDEILPEARECARFASLQYSRWTQVMLRFERAMYADPGQDLSVLWWDLVERYQGLQRPKNRCAPDYATQVHVVVMPVYYHNFMLGELFASQVHEAIAQLLGTSPRDTVYVGKTAVGDFLKTKFFSLGRRYHFDDLTMQLTGKSLSVNAFARRFVV